MPKPLGDSETVTLTANTVATVTLDDNYNIVEVINLTGAAEVWFTVDGSTPTVGGRATQCLPAAVGGFEWDLPGSVRTVKLISTGTPRIYVRGW